MMVYKVTVHAKNVDEILRFFSITGKFSKRFYTKTFITEAAKNLDGSASNQILFRSTQFHAVAISRDLIYDLMFFCDTKQTNEIDGDPVPEDIETRGVMYPLLGSHGNNCDRFYYEGFTLVSSIEEDPRTFTTSVIE